MFILILILLVVAAGVLQHNIPLGAAIFGLAIYLGGKAARMTDGDDVIMAIIFLIGIASIPIVIILALL